MHAKIAGHGQPPSFSQSFPFEAALLEEKLRKGHVEQPVVLQVLLGSCRVQRGELQAWSRLAAGHLGFKLAADATAAWPLRNRQGVRRLTCLWRHVSRHGIDPLDSFSSPLCATVAVAAKPQLKAHHLLAWWQHGTAGGFPLQAQNLCLTPPFSSDSTVAKELFEQTATLSVGHEALLQELRNSRRVLHGCRSFFADKILSPAAGCNVDHATLSQLAIGIRVSMLRLGILSILFCLHKGWSSHQAWPALERIDPLSQPTACISK